MSLAVAGISLLAVAVVHTTTRPDGSTIFWSLDGQRDVPKQGILLVAQGSGCLSTSENPNLARARSLLPDFAFLTVEKYGVHPHDAPKDWMGGCRAEFYAHHTVSQRAADYQRVLGELASAPWWDGRLVLFGGSEGGAAVVELAPRVKPNAVVIFSNSLGRFRQDFKLVVPPDVAAMADAEFAKIAADPLSPKLWGGNSYRWYADIMDHDLTTDALAVHAPILLVLGERDLSGVAVNARNIPADFQRAGHCNLTYWEFPGYDHEMRDAAGVSHLDEVLRGISGWLREKVRSPVLNERCESPQFPTKLPPK